MMMDLVRSVIGHGAYLTGPFRTLYVFVSLAQGLSLAR